MSNILIVLLYIFLQLNQDEAFLTSVASWMKVETHKRTVRKYIEKLFYHSKSSPPFPIILVLITCFPSFLYFSSDQKEEALSLADKVKYVALNARSVGHSYTHIAIPCAGVKAEFVSHSLPPPLPLSFFDSC